MELSATTTVPPTTRSFVFGADPRRQRSTGRPDSGPCPERLVRPDGTLLRSGVRPHEPRGRGDTTFGGEGVQSSPSSFLLGKIRPHTSR